MGTVSLEQFTQVSFLGKRPYVYWLLAAYMTNHSATLLLYSYYYNQSGVFFLGFSTALPKVFCVFF